MGCVRERNPPKPTRLPVKIAERPKLGFSLARPLSPKSTFNIVAVFREDSDLEAFSHNPTDGSFAATDRSIKHMNQMSEPAVPLVLSRDYYRND